MAFSDQNISAIKLHFETKFGNNKFKFKCIIPNYSDTLDDRLYK